MVEAVSTHKLAVIIPAFKKDYLARSLACLLRQTDQRFNLYICDDASPADIEGIARLTLGARPYIYKRFENNLGRSSLPKHWNRCVALSSEPWVWLFSDDDLMDDNCVEAFYNFLQMNEASADVVHFSLWKVDENDEVTDLTLAGFEQETWLEFAYGHFMGWRIASSQNLIFSRSAFDKEQGILDLPSGWQADAATIIAFGRYRGIRRIANARVFWRSSQQHITSDISLRARSKRLQAACLLCRWFQRQLEMPRAHLFPSDSAAFFQAMDRFLVTAIMSGGLFPAIANWKLISRTRAEIGHGSVWGVLRYIAMATVNDGFSAFGRIVQAFKKSSEIGQSRYSNIVCSGAGLKNQRILAQEENIWLEKNTPHKKS